MSDPVYVLWWRYHDNSGSGVERVYEAESDAMTDCELLNKHSSVEYMVTAVPWIEVR